MECTAGGKSNIIPSWNFHVRSTCVIRTMHVPEGDKYNGIYETNQTESFR